jgi:hypothetical protein
VGAGDEHIACNWAACGDHPCTNGHLIKYDLMQMRGNNTEAGKAATHLMPPLCLPGLMHRGAMKKRRGQKQQRQQQQGLHIEGPVPQGRGRLHCSHCSLWLIQLKVAPFRHQLLPDRFACMHKIGKQDSAKTVGKHMACIWAACEGPGSPATILAIRTYMT